MFEFLHHLPAIFHITYITSYTWGMACKIVQNFELEQPWSFCSTENMGTWAA
jgi:hypothetical protein